jgi:glucose/arabinose dehydrogenase
MRGEAGYTRCMQAFRAVRCLLWALVVCCACAQREDEAVTPELGLAFVPVETRTSADDGQTLAHMELTGLAFLPGEQGLLAWEKSGRVVHYHRDSDDALTRVGEFRIQDIEQESDCGLISIALDPDWETNHFLFAGHCISPFYSQVTRYHFDPSGDYAAVADSARTVIDFGDARASRAWHNVGAMGFFDDETHSMWILVGDKRDADNAQDHSTNLGGILRIIPSRERDGGYEPHPDNPFGGPGSDPELQSSPDLYAWGLRSPWRGARDEQGRIWIGDVGERIEEINLSTGPGQNFGWGESDGPCNEKTRDCEGLTDPVAWWGRSSDHKYVREDGAAHATSARVAWVGSGYRSSASDPYEGLLDSAMLVSDMCVGFVRAFSVDAKGKVTRDEQLGHLVGLSGAAQAPDGQLYFTSFGDCTSATFGVGGGIYRAVLQKRAAEPVELDHTAHGPLVEEPLGPMPPKLSDTGIFENVEARKPSARAIAYEPTLPLWSNGSTKHRLLFLPRGQQVDNARRDHWEFPAGTFFVKSFGYTDAQNPGPVETRIIRRTEDGWDYHVYRWRDGDAYLLSLERPIPAPIRWEDGRKLQHEIPSRFDCRSCHEHNETVVIGFDELRLNDGEQLQQLHERGVFSQPLPAAPAQLFHPDRRTRGLLGYLHGNCAHCHNRSQQSESPLDLTYPNALQNSIGVETQGSGQAAGIRVAPGFPERSVLFLALSGESDDPELKPMPPVGVQLRDAATIELMRSWIADLPP